jgi:hypothetical protein
MFPKRDEERRLLASYHEQDTAAAADRDGAAMPTPTPAET